MKLIKNFPKWLVTKSLSPLLVISLILFISVTNALHCGWFAIVTSGFVLGLIVAELEVFINNQIKE